MLYMFGVEYTFPQGRWDGDAKNILPHVPVAILRAPIGVGQENRGGPEFFAALSLVFALSRG